MLATSKNVLFPGHNHLLTISTDNLTLIIGQAPERVIIKVKGHQHQWLAGGYDLKIEHFQKWLAWWLPGEEWLFVQCPFCFFPPRESGCKARV